MKSKLITITLGLVLISAILFLGIFVFNKKGVQEKSENMTVLPGNISKTIKPSPTSTPTPIKFNFDKSTNLQKELDTINPEVLNSDFDNPKATISKL